MILELDCGLDRPRLMMDPTITAVCSDSFHNVSKYPSTRINLLIGFGVEGDAHAGATTRHLYLMKRDPGRPNLSQVHLLHSELHDLLNAAGFDVSPGVMGENITTCGISLMVLPRGTRLHLGESAIVEVTGFRQPCRKLNALRSGLMDAVFAYDARGYLIANAGIMAIVIKGGEVRQGDAIQIELPPKPHLPLLPV